MRKYNALPSKFTHPQARMAIRGMQLTCMLVDKIYDMESKRDKFNALPTDGN